MSIATALIEEMMQEAVNTRKLLALAPAESFGWAPHEKSMKLGHLATHIAQLHKWTTITMTSTELDLASDMKAAAVKTTEELLAFFDERLTEARQHLEAARDEDFAVHWTLRKGDYVIMTLPRLDIVRKMVFNHMVHHRGQLSVYLRLLNIPIPGMYGPSADGLQ